MWQNSRDWSDMAGHSVSRGIYLFCAVLLLRCLMHCACCHGHAQHHWMMMTLCLGLYLLCVWRLCVWLSILHAFSLCGFFFYFISPFCVCPSCRVLDIPIFWSLGHLSHTQRLMTCLLSGDKNSLFFSVGHLRLCCGANAAVIEVMHYNLYWLLNLSEGIKFFFF